MERKYTVFSTSHPAVLLLYVLMAPILGMCTRHPLFLLVNLTGAVLVHGFYFGAGRTMEYLLKMLPFFAMIVGFNFFMNTRGMHTLFRFGSHPFTLESLLYGVSSAVMLLVVLLWFACFPVILSNDKFLYLFGRTLPGTALLLSMILKLFPDTRYRMRSIQYADKTPVTSEKKDLLTRIKKGLVQISTLLEWSMEDSIEMADSMKARGYGEGKRTSYQQFHWTSGDLLLSVWFLLVCVCSIWQIRVWSTQLRWYPYIVLGKTGKESLATALCYFFFLMTPICMEMKGRCKR